MANTLDTQENNYSHPVRGEISIAPDFNPGQKKYRHEFWRDFCPQDAKIVTKLMN